MKKIIYSIALTICVLLSPLAFTGCASGYNVDPNNLIGVWEITEEGGYIDISRIEFHEPAVEGSSSGSLSYYLENGTTTYYGSWGPKSAEASDEFMVTIHQYEGELSINNPYGEILLAEGRLYLMFPDGETGTTQFIYRKIKD